MTTLTGHCLCGAVTYAIEATGEVSVCHCETCLRFVGGPFIGVEGKSLAIEGPVLWYQSSDWAERASCSVCGTAFGWRTRDGAHPAVTAGSLDDPSVLEKIDRHIFVEEKPAFYAFADTAPRLTGPEAIAIAFEEMKAEDA